MFKDHCSLYDITDNPIKLSGDKLALLVQQNKKKVKSISGRHGNSSATPYDALYSVTYCGSMNIKLKTISAATVDGFVSCLAKDRPIVAKKYKKWRKRRRSSAVTAPLSNSMFRSSSTGDDEPIVLLPEYEERPRSNSDEIIPSITIDKPLLSKTNSDTGLRKKQVWIHKGNSHSSTSRLDEEPLLSDSDQSPVQVRSIGRSITAPTPATRVELLDSSTEQEEIDGEEEPNDEGGKRERECVCHYNYL